MAVFGVRQLALFVGGAGLVFGGCGEGQGSDAPGAGGSSMSGSAGLSGTTMGGNGGFTGRGGTSAGGAAGGATAVGGAVAHGGSASGGNPAGTAGTGTAGTGTAGAGTAGAGAGAGGTGSAGTASVGGAPPATDCEPGTGFVGQLTGPGSPAPNGGIFTTNPHNVAYGDANLAGVIAAYPAGDEVHPINVAVHEAVVTATAGATPGPGVSASRTDFWIADDHALLKVALDPALGASCCADFEVRTGMRISFKATEVSTFISLGQITAASSFVAGAQGSCVLVAEPNKITDVDFYQMVRVSAKLGDTAGGGSWHLGLNDGILYDFMSTDANLQKGQTVTFVGPVSPYVGSKMLVESNPDWVKVTN